VKRKPTAAPRAAAPAAAPATLRWFAVVAPGLEAIAQRELEGLPDVADIAAETGGVAWTGPTASGYRVNLWSRVATRVLARVGEVEAREFGKLRHRAARLPWPTFVAAARRWRRAPAPAIAASITRAGWPRPPGTRSADAVRGARPQSATRRPT
jgi:hypothetical protein